MESKESYMMSHPEEYRAVVPALDKKYWVSNYGNVEVEEKGVRKAVTPQSDGRYVYVRSGGKTDKVSVAYMVARAFVNNTCLRPYVKHKDGDSRNNCAGNLDWWEYPEVITVNHVSRSHAKGVIQYNKDGEVVKRWNSVSEASRGTGLTRARILEVIRGDRNIAGGYMWRFEV